MLNQGWQESVFSLMMQEKRCRVCTDTLVGRERFCPECGTRVATNPPAFVSRMVVMPEGRVARHRQTLGVLWCVSGVWLVLGAVVVAVWLRRGGSLQAELSALIVAVVGVLAVLSFAAGYGLLMRRPWGRRVALVAGVVGLLRPPLGATLGGYTLWVLGRGVE